VPVVGYLGGSMKSLSVPAFRQGLGELGYVEGQNVEILYHNAQFQYDRLPALAADLVRRRVAVIFAAETQAAVPAKLATATIPIVFSIGGDPVELGLVASINRPGGNVTGVTFRTQELTAKRLELLHEIVPAAMPIGLLVNPTNNTVKAEIGVAEAAARVLGVRLVIQNASNRKEIDPAFAILVEQRIGALLVSNDLLFGVQGAQIVALAARHAVPAIYARRGEVEAGGLMSYGANLSDARRLAGTYVGRILKGEKPAELPVQQSTRFEMVLNLKVAKALGIEVPTATLLRADAVIE
jgi:putative tryptophan/tyrosine transport system substrate-binding protein